LEALMRRVHHLEFQAVSHHKLPDNPQQTLHLLSDPTRRNLVFCESSGSIACCPVKVLTLLSALHSSKTGINPIGDSGRRRALRNSLIHPNHQPRLETLTKPTPTRRMRPAQRVWCAKRTSVSSAIMCKSKLRRSASRRIS
jgi:hypothetical protein